MEKNKQNGKSFLIFAMFSLLIFTMCATLKDFRSGREVVVEKPLYFKVFSKVSVSNARIGHLPIMLDKRAGDPSAQKASLALLAAMNSFLSDRKWTRKLAAINLSIDDAPDLFYGNPAMFRSPVNSSNYNDEDQVHPPMVLFYRNASTEWKTQLPKVADDVDYVLFITVGLSEYFVRQTNLLGKKELSLGTGYSVPLKWLTSLDDPIEVLQVTGALMDRSGKILRVGAEGIMAAKPASFLESVISLQNAISEEEITRVIKEVSRDDLPGKPLSYQAALQNLAGHLLQRNDLILK